MKILSLVLFIVALVWTWNLTHRIDKVPYSSHEGLQAEIAVIIEEAVRRKRPNMQNFLIEKVWTETIDDDRVRAEYTYSFVDGDDLEASQSISGELTLKRMKQSNTDEVWQLEKVQTTNESLTFTRGITVRPGDSGTEFEDTEAEPMAAEALDETGELNQAPAEEEGGENQH